MPSHNVSRRRRTRQGLNPSPTQGPDARSCPHCGRTFKRTEHLERHIRTRQSSHWPHVCDSRAHLHLPMPQIPRRSPLSARASVEPPLPGVTS